MKIRPATSGDAAGIRACLEEAFEPYRGDYTEAAFAATVPPLGEIIRRCTSMTVHVAVAPDEGIAGTISASMVGAGEGHLRSLAVRLSWQKRGVAAALLESAESSLRDAGCARITLDTTPFLGPAITLYEACGYARTGRTSDLHASRSLNTRNPSKPDSRASSRYRKAPGDQPED